MFNLITHKINNERSDYLYTHFLLETNGSAPFLFPPLTHFTILVNLCSVATSQPCY